MNSIVAIPSSKRPVLTGIVVFILATILTQYLSYQSYLIQKEAKENEVLREINLVKDRLKTTLSYSLSATKTLAFLVEEYGVPRDFNKVAKDILEANKFIDAVELTKQGVITHVYPLKGNEGVIGYDILRDSLRNLEAFRAIEKKGLYFAGPFELKQGGIAIVGRLPIFKDQKFWGFSVVIVKLATLLKSAGIDTAQNGDYFYQLSKVNPSTLKEEFFLPHYALSYTKGGIASIQVPDGEWNLYVIPKSNNNLFNIIFLSLFGLLFSGTSGLFAWQMAKQPEKLRGLVEEKTMQLAASEKYFRSLIEKSADAIVLIDQMGKVLYQSPSTERISGYSLREMHELDGVDLIHPDDRENDSKRFAQLVRSPWAVLKMNHRFKHKNGHYIWLEGTYSNLLNDENVRAIVYNYYEVTERVMAEEQMAEEKKLSESIINSLPGVFFLFNSNGNILRWNKNHEIVSGYSTEETGKMSALDFVDPDDKAYIAEKINAVYEFGSAEATANFYTKDKRKIPYYLSAKKANFNGVDYLLGMGIDITDRLAAENELRARTKEIQKLTAHMERIQEDERTRIAREIHDELGQQLTGLKMDAYWIEKKMSFEDRLMHEKISGMISMIDETIKTVRRIASELRPGILDDLGLMAALEWQGQEFEKRSGIKTRFHTDMSDFNPEREISTNIFRVYQEALTNIMRHANATEVDTTLEERDAYVILSVKDNGCGFELQEAENKNSLGLTGMKERALLFQGELSIASEKLKGTVITLKVPVVNNDKTKL